MGIYNFGSSFASPSGKIHFRKTDPKRKTKSLKTYKVFEATKLQLGSGGPMGSWGHGAHERGGTSIHGGAN